jgi:hypothetical protein
MEHSHLFLNDAVLQFSPEVEAVLERLRVKAEASEKGENSSSHDR